MMHTLLLASLFFESSAVDTTVLGYSSTSCEGEATNVGSFGSCTKIVGAATCIEYIAKFDDDPTKSILLGESEGEGARAEPYSQADCKGTPMRHMGMDADNASKVQSAQCFAGFWFGMDVPSYYKWSASAPEYGTLSMCTAAGCSECTEVATAGTVKELDAECCDWSAEGDPAEGLLFGCLSDGSIQLRKSSAKCNSDLGLGFDGWMSKDNADKAQEGKCYAYSVGGENMNLKLDSAVTVCGGSNVEDASSTAASTMPLATLFMSLSILVAVIQV